MILAGTDPLTTSTAPVDLVIDPLVAMIVNAYDPRGVAAEVTMFKPVAAAPVKLPGLNTGLAPAGNPVADKVTCPENPCVVLTN